MDPGEEQGLGAVNVAHAGHQALVEEGVSDRPAHALDHPGVGS